MVCELQFAVQTYFFYKIDKVTRLHSVKELFQARHTEIFRTTPSEFYAINQNMLSCERVNCRTQCTSGPSPLSR